MNFNKIVATSDLKLRNKALLEAANTISSAQRRSAVKTLDECGLGEHRREQRQEQTRGANKGAASAQRRSRKKLPADTNGNPIWPSCERGEPMFEHVSPTTTHLQRVTRFMQDMATGQ